MKRWTFSSVVIWGLIAAGAALLPATADALVVDQEQPVMDVGGFPLAIGGASEQLLAQVVTVGVAGPLAAVRLPVACSTGPLVVEIQGVTGGLPNGTVLTSQSVAGGDLPPFPPGSASFRTITFAAPVSFAGGDQLAIVLRSAGVCSIIPGPAYDAYAAGTAYYDSRPNPPGVWLALTSGDDLPFQTLVAVSRTVGLDIRPRNPRNVIRPGGHGRVTVAVLSESGFDASTVDETTVAFGPAGAAPDGAGTLRDVNGDGLDDLLLDFRIDATGIACGDTSATLTAMTTLGEEISGSDVVTTVGCR